MNFLKKHKGTIISAVIILAVLVFTYFWQGNAPSKENSDTVTAVQNESNKNDRIISSFAASELDEETVAQVIAPEEAKQKESSLKATQSAAAKEEQQEIIREETVQKIISEKAVQEALHEENVQLSEKDKAEEALKSEESSEKDNISYSTLKGMLIDRETGTDKYNTQPVPEGKPVPIEPQTVTISDRKLSCTLSVRCDTLLSNQNRLEGEKVELVPHDGVIFAEREVTFFEGESVFNILLREMKKNKIHMEYSNTPIYNSVYIEGIGNLYEFDCGELSGWMYKVNGWFPNYGCSRYQLKQGDRVEWVYTCDLGADVGENFKE